MTVQDGDGFRKELNPSYLLLLRGREPEAVIATSEATKQSILSLRGEMDCFAEPVIGRAFARPVGSQ
jgi:hypothetical protein